MEYIQSKPNNIDVYVNEFHTRIKTEFEKSINKIYNEELSVYRQVIETVVKLPFIQEIIEENKTLKAKLKKLEEADNIVKLEIFDKPVSKTLLDVETIPFSSESNSSANSDDDDADDESSGDEGDSSEDEDDDLPIAIKEDKVETTTKSIADAEADEEEEEEESSDADDEQSVDEEDKSPTFPVKIIVNKLDKEEDNLEEVEEEEEPSADQEEVETETEEVEEEEEYTEEEIAYNKIDDVMFNKKCLNTDMKKNVKLVEEVEEEEEPSADQEDAEVIEIEIDGKTYYCESEENGNIYEDDNGEVGNIVGEIKDGEATFFE